MHLEKYAHPGGLESQFHLEAKHLVAHWARRALKEQGSHAQVTIESRDEVSGRRADVIIDWPSGRRIAFEIEYKPSTPEDWRRRHESYANAGIRVVWLWGHTRHLRRETRRGLAESEGVRARYRLTTLLEAVAATSTPVFFVNPTVGAVGTYYTSGTALDAITASDMLWWMKDDPVGNPLHVRTEGKSQPIYLQVSPLDACLLDEDLGLVTPTLQAMEHESERVASARAQAIDAFQSATNPVRAARTRAEAGRRIRPMPPPGTRSTAPSASLPPALTCSRCGGRLDVLLQALGRHVGC